MNTYDTKMKYRFGGTSFSSILACALTLAPIGGYAFEYNYYEHYSYANCSADNTTFSSIHCDIPTGDDRRRPNNISAIVVHSKTAGFEGQVGVCMTHLTTGLALCKEKTIAQGEGLTFDTADLIFNWDTALSWGGDPSWWNWVVSLTLYDTEMSVDEALRGYKVFFNIP